MLGPEGRHLRKWQFHGPIIKLISGPNKARQVLLNGVKNAAIHKFTPQCICKGGNYAANCTRTTPASWRRSRPTKAEFMNLKCVQSDTGVASNSVGKVSREQKYAKQVIKKVVQIAKPNLYIAKVTDHARHRWAREFRQNI